MITATLDSSNYTKGANKMLIVISACYITGNGNSVPYLGHYATKRGQSELRQKINALIFNVLIPPGTTCTLPQVWPATQMDLLTDFRVAPFRARQRQLRV